MTINVGQPNNKFDTRVIMHKAADGLRLSHLMRRSWHTKGAFILVLATIASCLVTYSAMSNPSLTGQNRDLVFWLLNVDLILLLLLTSLVARRIVHVWSGRKRGVAGSNLHIRFVLIFSVLVAIPTIIMTVFSALFFHYGIQAWFSHRVQTAIHESQAVAQSYLEEHKEVIRADTLAMANDLSRQSNYFSLNPESLSKALDTQSFFRNLSEAIVITGQKDVIARSALTFTLEYEAPSPYDFSQARLGETILVMNEEQDRVRALVKLDGFRDAYLFVGRMIDPQVLEHLKAAQLASEDYNNLKGRYTEMQITATLLFLVIGLLLLLAAIWSGLLISRELVTPIGELIKAADRIRAGDLTSRLPQDKKRLEEFEYLAASFNRMTQQLQNQRADLVEANRQIDRRRHLTETVLAGVSSGVIGIDGAGNINLANNSAAKLLSASTDDITARHILEIFPQIDELFTRITSDQKISVQGEIEVMSDGAGKRIFFCRISKERMDDANTGFIITFDDITDIQAAQRTSAWSDVARRIAHEIKNPLTPIQLSAERLKRKYLKQIENDPETFAQCTDTIVRHVTDIGRMVDEFSSFARMPEPILKNGNIQKAVEESLFLLRQAHPEITFKLQAEEGVIPNAAFDARQIRQVFTNLIQNSIDAIDDSENGRIEVYIGIKDDDFIYVDIADNGPGFPKDEDITKLTEPYITHKEKGTGLGLAIVKKIMDDHGGRIILGLPSWMPQKDINGAHVVLVFPRHINNSDNNKKATKSKSE